MSPDIRAKMMEAAPLKLGPISTRLHCSIFKKKVIFILAAVRT
jgi:hypothetical protein